MCLDGYSPWWSPRVTHWFALCGTWNSWTMDLDHEGKNIFGVTVEFTPATTSTNFKLHYIEVAFEKKEGIFEYVSVDVGSMENFWLC